MQSKSPPRTFLGLPSCGRVWFRRIAGETLGVAPPRGTAAKYAEARERTAALEEKAEPLQAAVVEVELRLANEGFQIPSLVLRQACMAFQAIPLYPHHSVISAVSSEIFQTFLSAVKGESIEVTPANFAGL
jgi:hypothetical protein